MFKNKFNISLPEKEIVNIIGINNKVQAEYVWNLFCVASNDLIVVTNTLYEATQLHKSLVYSHDNIYLYPMDDFLVSESLAMSPDLLSIRIDTLNELSFLHDKKLVITNLNGYLRFLPSIDLWKSSKITLKVGDTYNREDLIKKLDTLGYKRESLVTSTGEYSFRGYILDVFPYSYDFPIRIEFFDDEIESIRSFSSDDQLSLNKLEDVLITPFTEFLGEVNNQELKNKQSLLPRVSKQISSISGFLYNPNTVFIDYDGILNGYNNLLNEIAEYKETDEYEINNYMHDFYSISPEIYVNISKVDNVIKGKNIYYDTKDILKFNGNYTRINEFIKENIRRKKKIIFVLENKDIISSLESYLDVKCVITNENRIFDNKINIIISKLYNGFIIDDYVVLTQNELFKKNFVSNYKNKFKYGSKIKDINKLSIGDYVVHLIHGIGRYLGLKTLETNGLKKDFITVEYKNSDKLYIPVEKIELLSKFSSKEGAVPKLNKLGGTDWYKQKSRVKSKVKDIAEQLLKLSAERKLLPGFSFLKDDAMQIKFDNDFEYKETKDQIKVINEIKKDMESPHPMDRLLCGDVGYGKTEVAFRAVFKAIRSGKQVAFLCPTTILSNQHYENALIRFENYGVNIAVLNRFITPKVTKQVLEDTKNGKIDLLIGTHRIFSKDVKFKDLGLLIIDEEQRFGVTHKEKIKELKKNIDVLTLSATPIPRTLQMSLSGIRGLSLIETPPIDRYPVQTYVLKENDSVIKDAIYKELNRDGQVFILYNKVASIEDQVSKIQKLVPEANITFIHGQMSKSQIESTMEEFILGTYNVLICTTIIETGIDIQNANTLIILDADHFGLSQLYQIRGRIGRGSNIGYAYLMYKKNKELNDIAVKRLNAIKEFTELGSGYSLALRDLSIRGAGDILGAEQSGFIDSVGYDLYLKILNEEVEKLKGNEINEEVKDEKPFLQVSTHINNFYASSEELKVEFHKLINTIDSLDKYNEVKQELEDRFGKLSDDIIIYMLEELFQALATKNGVIKVMQSNKSIIVYFNKEVSEKLDILDVMSYLTKITPNFDVKNANDLLKIELSLNGLEKHFLYYLIKIFEVIE